MLSIIIVNYKSEQKTIEYIQTELIKVTLPHIAVVVNNSATNNSNKELAEGLDAELVGDIEQAIDKNKRCFVVAHPENLGFAKGNNLGAEFSVKHFEVDYLLFSNNDIRFVDNDVVEQLITKISSLPNVGVIGPRVVGLDGKNQSPEPYYSFGLRYFWRFWFTPVLPKNWSSKLMKFDYSQKAKEGVHYKVMGSFFIVDRKDFVSCGMMDTNTFLYSEEVILSERMKSINKRVYYYPQVTIVHEHGATISKTETTQKISAMMFESESYYYSHYIKTPVFFIGLGILSNKLYNILKNNK